MQINIPNTGKLDLHDSAAEETDTNHEHPAGNDANVVDSVTKGHVQVVPSQPAIGGVQGTLVSRNLLEVLLGVDLVELLRSNGGGVHVDEVERSGQALFTFRLSLGDLVVEDGGSTGGPDGTENALFLAVQQTKVRGGWVGSEEEGGFLHCEDEIGEQGMIR